MKTKILHSFLIVLITLLLLSQSLFSQPKDWTILDSWSIPGQASGLAWDGTYFYFGIYGVNGDDVYKFDPSDGSSVLLFSSPSLEDSFGMTYERLENVFTGHRCSHQLSVTKLRVNTLEILIQINENKRCVR